MLCGVVNGKNFKTNEKQGNHLLQDDRFQVDDTTFHRYVRLFFYVIHENKTLNINDNIQINVDYTSDSDEFLILWLA